MTLGFTRFSIREKGLPAWLGRALAVLWFGVCLAVGTQLMILAGASYPEILAPLLPFYVLLWLGAFFFGRTAILWAAHRVLLRGPSSHTPPMFIKDAGDKPPLSITARLQPGLFPGAQPRAYRPQQLGFARTQTGILQLEFEIPESAFTRMQRPFEHKPAADWFRYYAAPASEAFVFLFLDSPPGTTIEDRISHAALSANMRSDLPVMDYRTGLRQGLVAITG